MTVIAYDGKTLAADRQITTGSMIDGYMKKILKWSGGVWSSSGRLTDERLFAEWLEDRNFRFKPYKDFQALFSENGVMYEVDHSVVPYKARPPAGLGDGGRAAQLLMNVGFTAKQACIEVCKHNVYCGGKVDSVDV